MTDFKYQDMFSLLEDKTEYRLLSTDHISMKFFERKDILVIKKEALILLAEQAFKEVSHLFRKSHLEFLRKIIDDPVASSNDKYVSIEMLRNAIISAEMIYPMCQDTGTAIIMGHKGQQIWTGFDDKKALSRGVYNTYTSSFLRYSQNVALNMYDEKNTGTNLPAQIDLYASRGDEYRFLFIAKGGGSANKTYLYQETKAIINKEKLVPFIVEKMESLGTTACPPYHLAFVIGGTSAELNLKTVKLVSAGYLDGLPIEGSENGHAFRDVELEKQVLEESRKLCFGAQFGGKYFAHDVKIVRLPRHSASCPIGLGVSCSADRNIKAKITKDGIFLEKLETNPARFLFEQGGLGGKIMRVDLDRPMDDIRAELTKYPVSTKLLLTGKILVGRDIAHAKIKDRLDAGENMPDYFKNHIIYYAGPAKIPNGEASGSFGPTTAGRMDSYVFMFQEKGGSMIMLAKGNRSKEVIDSCKKFGGFYLGSIGGTAARLGKECITKVEVLEYPEQGMEAIFMITVKDFPAVIIIDDKGNDLFQQF